MPLQRAYFFKRPYARARSNRTFPGVRPSSGAAITKLIERARFLKRESEQIQRSTTVFDLGN
jgi:hypothetical protein